MSKLDDLKKAQELLGLYKAEWLNKDIFEYCIKNNIPLDKKENGYKTSIRKHISTKDKIYLWGIDYLDTEKNLVKIIELNGKDGSISKTYEYPMPK